MQRIYKTEGEENLRPSLGPARERCMVTAVYRPHHFALKMALIFLFINRMVLVLRNISVESIKLRTTMQREYTMSRRIFEGNETRDLMRLPEGFKRFS